MKAITGKRPNFADRSVCATKLADLKTAVRVARKRCKAHAHQSWASYYKPEGTASDYAYTENTIGVANKVLPFGTKRFFHLRNRTQVAKVIDRGPYVAGREWDFTKRLKARLRAGDLAYVWSSPRNCWAVAR
jgi:rare lipoprotein A (peptidoglycan hydrolase)